MSSRLLATDDQQAEARRLLAAGASLRETAEAVFGEKRFKDRVSRIRQRAVDPPRARGARAGGHNDHQEDDARRRSRRTAARRWKANVGRHRFAWT